MIGLILERRLLGKKSALGADHSTSPTLLRVIGHGLRICETTVIEIPIRCRGLSGRPPGGAEAGPPLAGGQTSPPGTWISDSQPATACCGRG